jgi:resuscitation-promoting factor RpfA
MTLSAAAAVAATDDGDVEEPGVAEAPGIAEGTDTEVAIASTPPDPLDELETTVEVEDWKRLADCESGDWTRHGDVEPESARWNYGIAFDHGDIFQGGLNFHPQTWDAYRDPDMPEHAGLASRWEEIEVAERVLDDQGWDAWPVCSEMTGLADEST